MLVSKRLLSLMLRTSMLILLPWLRSMLSLSAAGGAVAVIAAIRLPVRTTLTMDSAACDGDMERDIGAKPPREDD